MNKKFISVISIMLILGMLFTSCTDNTSEETTDEIETITEAPVNGSEDEITEDTAEETEAETTTEETTIEEESALIGTVVGYTSKGYVITEKDGITYVDGVLVANKTYSLPENYNPGGLLSECEAAFNKMQSVCASEGLTIWNASGFRSYSLQESLYNRYCDRDGKEAADRYSARPGHSEHQSGLAIDLNEITSAFADTKEGKWIAENCYKYGFILRYPKEKEAQTGYMYEPWHIRYVGVDTATAIYNSGLCLEEYFGITSVYANTEEVTTEEETTVPEETTLEIVATEELTSAEETTVSVITD